MHSMISIHAGNRQAMLIGDAVCLHPGEKYNPLLIHGPAGCGKTDILHAVGKKIRMLHPHLKIQYVAGGSFTYTDWQHLTNQYDVILLDEADALIEEHDGSLILLDLIQRMTAQHKAILISSTAPLFNQSIEHMPGLQHAIQIPLETETTHSLDLELANSNHRYGGSGTNRNLNQAWESVMARFRTKVTDDSYQQWFSAVEPHFTGDKVTLHAPGEMHHDMIMLRYRTLVEQEIQEVLGADAPVIEWATRRTSTN